MNSINNSMNQEIAAMDRQENWQTKALITGGIVGAAVGLMTSWLLVRTARGVFSTRAW